MPPPTQVNVAGLDGGGKPVTLRGDQNADNSLALHVVPEVSGSPVTGVNPLPTTPGQLSPLGYQQITSLSAAQTLTVPVGATRVMLSIEVAAVRWRDDGAAPSSSVGMPLAAGAEPWLYSGNLAAIQFIQVTAGAVLNANYYR